MLRTEVNDFELKDRMVLVKGSPEKMIPLIGISMAAHYFDRQGPIMGKGTFSPEDEPYEKEPANSDLALRTRFSGQNKHHPAQGPERNHIMAVPVKRFFSEFQKNTIY